LAGYGREMQDISFACSAYITGVMGDVQGSRVSFSVTSRRQGNGKATVWLQYHV
jgi:hypothetical protein